jgi:hypothetical protein
MFKVCAAKSAYISSIGRFLRISINKKGRHKIIYACL